VRGGRTSSGWWWSTMASASSRQAASPITAWWLSDLVGCACPLPTHNGRSSGLTVRPGMPLNGPPPRVGELGEAGGRYAGGGSRFHLKKGGLSIGKPGKTGSGPGAGRVGEPTGFGHLISIERINRRPRGSSRRTERIFDEWRTRLPILTRPMPTLRRAVQSIRTERWRMSGRGRLLGFRQPRATLRAWISRPRSRGRLRRHATRLATSIGGRPIPTKRESRRWRRPRRASSPC